jgi:CRISPR-associated protein Cmr2
MNIWQRKLLAFLHDPPSKPFQVAEHREVADTLIRNAGFDPAEAAWFFDKVCDHTVAAADRLVCPKARAMKADWQAEAAAFKHPLGGGALHFDQKITAALAEDITTKAQPHALLYGRLSADKRDWARFFCHWRLWPREAARHDPHLAHLPADTRIPDHSIWTHCSLVSALQACVEVTGEGESIEWREFKPAFLLLQIGPVQEFISQARTTRDLWSGSYLLSWLVAHGIKAVTDQIGPDCVLFPSLRGQPLFDFLHKKQLYGEEALDIWKELGHAPAHILTPNLTNRFLAIVPEGKAAVLAKWAEQAMRDELEKSISNACLEWLQAREHPVKPDALDRWRQQLRQFLTIHWQVRPWERDVFKAIRQFKVLPLGKGPAEGQTISPADALERAYVAARDGIPSQDLDPRNYRHLSWKDGDVWKSRVTPGPDGLPRIENPGFAWAAHYAQVEFHLAARRNTRDFERWGLIPGATASAQSQADQCREGATKDVLSGNEETIGSRAWQEGLVNLEGHLFQEADRLGAMNIIKRIWHVAYLESEHDLRRLSLAFDSVPAVAAAAWRRKLVRRMRDDEGAWRNFLDFSVKAVATRHLGYFDIPSQTPDGEGRVDETKWLDWVDAAVFHQNEWQRAIREETRRGDGSREGGPEALTAASESLAHLQRPEEKGGLGKPLSYVAILAMDGDSMGEWLGGARSPKWSDQLAKESAAYFERQHPDAKSPDALKQLLNAPRHVSPSFHLQFSEALANFSLYLAGPIVESFDGQLVYSGGDDLVAMLPAESVLGCACALRMAFQGNPALCSVFPGVLPAKDDAWGFVALDGDWEGWSRLQRRSLPRGYQLIVPGKNADISAGIAIGHMHSPLQNLVDAARSAEKRAKGKETQGGYGKSAFAVSLFKRSGETIEWGAKWDSGANDLARFFASLSRRDGPLSGRFPYALAGLLRPYATPTRDREHDELLPFRIRAGNGFDPVSVFSAELHHVLDQQTRPEWRAGREREDFEQLAKTFLSRDCLGRTLEDFLGPFLTTTFIQRGGE